jgi:hypothetical protein
MEIECSFLKGVKYRTIRSVKRRILDFVTSASFIFLCFLFGYAALLAFLVSLTNDKNTPEDLKGKQIYSHIIVVERYNGLKDTIIYHDINKEVDTDYSDTVKDGVLTLNSEGKNWMGFSFDSSIQVENVKSYKVIK